MSNRTIPSSIVALLAGAALAACSRTRPTPADTSVATTPAPATAMADSASGEAATAASPALTDANIAAMVSEANIADSSAGALAAMKGTRADVRDYGRLMQRDHHRLRKGGDSLVMALGLSPMMPVGSIDSINDQAMYDSLNTMAKGAAWDRAYISDMVAGHQHVLVMLDSSIAAAQNPDLKAMLQKARPIVSEHLDKAQAIQKVIATMPPTL